jgi:3-deoxy-D-manno-octulosonate 8-phosphate phosphatase (KDO 8-P phosphatase)
MREADVVPSRSAVAPDDQALADGIRWVGFDVDGVLTDAGVYVGEHAGSGVELKRFDIRDGFGIKLLQWAGLDVAFVSARVSPATSRRAAELAVRDVVQEDGGHKVAAIERLLARKGLDWAQAAFVGDDLPDVAVLQRVALAAVPADGVAEARALAHWPLQAGGGRGAVREFAERLLRGRGEYDAVVRRYLAERGGRWP